ncbi:Ankyrin repeat-containing domain superfamily [Arabidopsis thaliana x Arabidopsis arenosa]|uniref:Ankyrin repeat-containing domain superfamily n=1 Tax=Arabidopsis thaliana x Arabidopsis arenosa TaxID=1240361 RepID=A0A8T2ENK7_9BRAS|nr:Ankyrin repeat-containing domain superfamily [Arabidopsis thaliana x Arabidopsis arenosa]KAG7624020.1 Ankyrin repeat-containing domain superfamily [Arabidopsis thaliana x Arabidopsis arenosa]
MDWRLLNAAATGDISILDLHQSEFEQRTPQNNNVLHIAAKHQRLDFATAILNLCPSLLLGENNNGDTPLHVAASVGSFEVSKLFVNSANQVTSDVENRGLSVTRKQLLRSTNKQNDTALNVALKNRHVDVAKFFVEEDTGLLMLDMANSNFVSPLYLAIERGLFNIANNILEISPLVSCKGPKGMNALHAAVDSDIVSTGFLRKLMEKRPEMIAEIDVIGWTPLHYSVWLGKTEITRLLLQQDSSAAYISDKEGQCPLHLAASTGQIDAYRELVRSCPYVWELVDDGNTPLHLSVSHKCYSILLLLLRNKRVDKHVMNRNHFTAAELFYSQKQEISFKVAMIYYALQRYYKQPSQQHNIETKTKQEKADLEVSNARNDGAMYEVHLLVAVLVATVAFAAAFQLPGGYKPDGTPALMDEPAFKCFLVFDTIAFCFSVTTVYFLFYASRDGYRARSAFLYMSALLMVVSLIAMASAFVSGMYLISSKSRGLAIIPFLMAGFFVLHGFIYWFIDPRGSYVLGLERPRRILRKLVYGNSLFHNLVHE